MKVGAGRLARAGVVSSPAAAFDVGLSIFGPLQLNFSALRVPSRGKVRSNALYLIEAGLGVALGSSELVSVACLFLVASVLNDVGSMAGDVPLVALALSSSALCGSSLLARGENRAKVAAILQGMLQDMLLIRTA
jgi:hypothetical protein